MIQTLVGAASNFVEPASSRFSSFGPFASARAPSSLVVTFAFARVRFARLRPPVLWTVLESQRYNNVEQKYDGDRQPLQENGRHDRQYQQDNFWHITP
jgi:hypothetical protein